MASLKSVINRLATAYRKWEAGAEDRAAKKIAQAESKAEQDKIRHKLAMDKLERKTQLENATAKANEAEARRRRAEQSIRQTGSSDFISRIFGTGSTTTKRRKSVRKSTRRKATRNR